MTMVIGVIMFASVSNINGEGIHDQWLDGQDPKLLAIENNTNYYSVSKNDIPLSDKDEDSNSQHNKVAHSGFPSPNYDSGWQSISSGTDVILNHNLGGNIDNYLVDLGFKSSLYGINEIYCGNVMTWNPEGKKGWWNMGCYWKNLTPENIRIRLRAETNKFHKTIEHFRIRIWIY